MSYAFIGFIARVCSLNNSKLICYQEKEHEDCLILFNVVFKKN